MTLATTQVSATRNHPAVRLGRWYAAGTAALLIFAGGAHADETVPQTTVRYEDLNLSRQADAGVLYSRLRAAATQVCSQYQGKDLRKIMQRRDCYNQALDNAVAKVDSSELNALHQARGNLRLAQRAMIERARS